MPFTSFVIATLALNLAPGPDMTYVAARSLGQGRRAGMISALGIAGGCLFHIAAAAAGVAVLLRTWPHAYTVIRIAGALYLIYLGVGLLSPLGNRSRSAADSPAVPASARIAVPTDNEAVIFRQGVVTNILNPKVALFFLAFLPQFVDPTRGGVALQTVALGAWFILSGTSVNVAVACLAGSARELLQSRHGRAWFQGVSGAILVALGVRLATTR
jgi:threonine/homoserine/homoserine lactone efflux protein